MKNLFEFYKGYKKENNKVLHKSNLFMSYFLMGLMLATLLLGVFAVCVSLSKGNTFQSIIEKAPLVIYMAIASIPVFFLSLAYAIGFKKKERKEACRLEITLYIETEDGFDSIIGDFYQDDDRFLLDMNKRYCYPKDSIQRMEEQDDKLYVYLEDFYFITDNEMKCFFEKEEPNE